MNLVMLLLTGFNVLTIHVLFGAMLTAQRDMQQAMFVPFASMFSIKTFFW